VTTYTMWSMGLKNLLIANHQR